MVRRLLFIAVLLILGLPNLSFACVISRTQEVRDYLTYNNPTDDKTLDEVGQIKDILEDDYRYDCIAITDNGYVKVEHGAPVDPAFFPEDRRRRQFVSFVPIWTFSGATINLKHGQSVNKYVEFPSMFKEEMETMDGHYERNSVTTPFLTESPTAVLPGTELSENFLKFFTSTFSKNKTYGDRWKFPMTKFPSTEKRPTTGPCGGKHIRSHRTQPHMKPIAMCLFAGASQEFRKKFCPNNSSHCRIMYGDAGYGHGRPSQWPHASHKRGECIDIWPMRKPGKGTVETNIYRNQKDIYNSDLTFEFAKILVKWGIETSKTRKHKPQAFFNDPKFRKLGFKHLVNHHDHLHVCFRDNKSNRNKCAGFRRDPGICHFGLGTPAGTVTSPGLAGRDIKPAPAAAPEVSGDKTFDGSSAGFLDAGN